MTVAFDVVLAPPFVGLVSGTDPKTLGDISITNTGDETPTTLYLIALTSGRSGTGGAAAEGQELIDEHWLEVSQDGGATWAGIGGDPGTADNRLTISSIPAPGDAVTIKAKLTVPVGALTAGDLGFSVEVALA